MRRAVLGLMLGGLIATPAHAERFAIACRGLEMVLIARPGAEAIGGQGLNRRTIYVVDEEARTVEEYIPKERRLREVCLAQMSCSREFSADRVMVSGTGATEKVRISALFDWDRPRKQLQLSWEIKTDDGVVMYRHATLKCAPSKMPRLAGEK
jgi:hypothetical protein